ncbi:hypothetical protein [Barrientosiimonas endolithica]|uniref:YcaO domain-containing protein n=1 Tax=Barrientosiimonas endolithica TaxID=1535208 RepID=A0ABM8HFY4_9MICO|nr:hypothetical protein [Barrientosiimonas endolithica]BDZ59872.1 hypothetical protein GCM10025872_35290 [Barrientosiimonas endolithica]
MRVDADLDLTTGRIERGGLTGTISKPARRGTTVGDGCVSYVFADVPLDPAELSDLQGVMAEIPYLGRPTSPAVVDAHVLERADVAAMSRSREVWSPADHGARMLRVATSSLLDALDKREEQRRAFGRPGFHPSLGARPTATYSVSATSETAEVESWTPARLGDVQRWWDDAVVYWFTPLAAPEALLALGSQLSGDVLAVPVLVTQSRRGLETHGLREVLVRGQGPEALYLVRDGDVGVARPRRDNLNSARKLVLKRVLGRSAAWTTQIPVPAERSRLTDECQRLAEQHGAQLQEVTVHDVARDERAPQVDFHPGLTHVSLLLDREVIGPLQLGAFALEPVGARTE